MELLWSDRPSINPGDGGESNKINFAVKNHGHGIQGRNYRGPACGHSVSLDSNNEKCDAEHGKAHSICSKTTLQDFARLVVRGAMILRIRIVNISID